ncbi:MAG: alpha/beta hydrolase [Promicromonosporaceae bacterium]|nr:alpha/beta hydrolase [Promicromonosporaceae bacterium]
MGDENTLQFTGVIVWLVADLGFLADTRIAKPMKSTEGDDAMHKTSNGEQGTNIRKSNRIFAEDADEVAGRDRQYANHARRLADLMESFRKQIIAIGQSFNPDGSFNFGPLLSLDNWNQIRNGLEPAQLANLLAALGDHAQVRSLWDTLSPTQREALINTSPAIIGNLNGIPIGYRAQANNINMAMMLEEIYGSLEELGVTRDELMAPLWIPGSHMSAIDIDLARQLLAARGVLTQYLGDFVIYEDHSGQIQRRPVPHVIAFDWENHSIITYFGDFDSSGDIPKSVSNVSIYVPGTNTRIGDFTNADNHTHGYFAVANGRGAGDTVVFGFGDGRFPQNLFSALHADASGNLGANLSTFFAGLPVHPHQRTSVIGYSYGGASVGIAQSLGMCPTAVLHLGSAGLGHNTGGIADLQCGPDTQVFAIVSPNDFVTWLPQRSLGGLLHGNAVAADPDVTRLEHGFQNSETQGRTIDRGNITGAFAEHDEIRWRDSTAHENSVSVITGECAVAYMPGGVTGYSPRPDMPTCSSPDGAWIPTTVPRP